MILPGCLKNDFFRKNQHHFVMLIFHGMFKIEKGLSIFCFQIRYDDSMHNSTSFEIGNKLYSHLIGRFALYSSFAAIKDYKFKHFEIDDAWFVNGINYWQTLNKWHTNFWNNMHMIYPEQMDSKRVDHWNKYFVLCKAIFFPENGQACGNGQYLFYKEASS